MQGWHRSAEARRPRRSSSPTSPSSRSGTSTPPLLDPLASPLALGLELDSKISALEEQQSPRKATAHLSPSKIPHTTPSTLSEPLSHLSKALVTLSNAKRTPELMSGETAIQQVRFALEGVLDLAISMSGTSLSVEDVLEACLEKQQRPATSTAPAPSDFTSAERSPSTEPTPTTADRLHALEKSNTASQVAILERLTRVEKQLKKQGRRSAMGSPAPSVAESTCDCEGRKSELEKREEAMEVQSKEREASMLSNIMPLVKKHREDLKAATVVAGERFRTQALAQVQATLQAAGPAARDSTQTNTDLFFVWYCQRQGIPAPTTTKHALSGGREGLAVHVDGIKVGRGECLASARLAAAERLQRKDPEMATEWVANCSALVAERETAVLEEVAVALRREKTAYEARLGSLGWRLEEDARGLLYRSSR